MIYHMLWPQYDSFQQNSQTVIVAISKMVRSINKYIIHKNEFDAVYVIEMHTTQM